DFGFTPATNFQQLKRAALGIGERAEISVVWYDIGGEKLTELPQIYERRDETHYWYQSPPTSYEAILELDATGFVRVYPELSMVGEEAEARLPVGEPIGALASSEEK